MIREILQSVLKDYLYESRRKELDKKLRSTYTDAIQNILSEEGDRYVTVGSTGKYGNWAKCPWIAIFDSLVTTSAQYGYYLVYLFKSDMSGVYLSLNQGVTDVKKNYKRDAKDVLVTRAKDFRDKLKYENNDFIDILVSRNALPNMYEKGNILARYYAANNIPDESELIQDLERFLDYYKALVYSDSTIDIIDLELAKTVEERKQRKLHERFDRRGNVALKVKKVKGYKCQVCGFVFKDKYGELGNRFIEAHHLKPFSLLKEGKIKLDINNDFAVLCSNCHRMIHRLPDSSKIDVLRDIIKNNSALFSSK